MHVRFRLLCISCVLLLVCSAFAPGLHGQAVASEADWQSLLKDISKTSREIRTLKTHLQDLNQQGDQLANEEESVSHSCRGSDNQHEECASARNEEAALDQRRGNLLQEWQAGEQHLRSLEDHVTGRLAKIRAAKDLQGKESWTQELRKCAALPPSNAVSCLDQVKPAQP